MPANITQIGDAIQVDWFLGNYNYADIISSMENLKFKLAVDLNRLVHKNAGGTAFKLMHDGSTTSNIPVSSVLFTDANGAAINHTGFLYTVANGLSVVNNVKIGGVLSLVKTTIEPWGGSYAAFQVGGTFAMWGSSTEISGSDNYLSTNLYRDTALKRVVVDEVTAYRQINGQHLWYTKESGTKDTDIGTLTERMLLTSVDHSTAQTSLAIGKGWAEAWDTGRTAFQLGGNFAIMSEVAEGQGKETYIMQNVYYDGAFKRFAIDETSMIKFDADRVLFYCDASGSKDIGFTPTERLRVDVTGIGVNTALNASWDVDTVIELNGATANSSIIADIAELDLLNNAYYDGSNYRYMVSSFATRYQQIAGGHIFHVAVLGTGGNVITFDPVLVMNLNMVIVNKFLGLETDTNTAWDTNIDALIEFDSTTDSNPAFMSDAGSFYKLVNAYYDGSDWRRPVGQWSWKTEIDGSSPLHELSQGAAGAADGIIAWKSRMRFYSTSLTFNADQETITHIINSSDHANALYVQGSNGNVGIGTNTSPTANATRVLFLGDNGATNPTMGANTAGFFAKDVDVVMSPFAIDEGGGFQQLAPHDHKTWNWVSLTGVTKGKRIVWKKYQMELLMNKLIDLLDEHGIKSDHLFEEWSEHLN